ncbi:MAG TPA: alpha/beta fold hydrolase [Solirubrobacteraceae bacterium]|jgi:pimeloyl-ACP methyl ester carboxylesterase|nr:alpha/beta fold hydrolase [Solirubrobacteraceae bacterium]
MVDTTTAAAVWTPGTVAAGGERRLRYWEAGRGTPLVILHGGGGVDLAPAYERLALQARVICLELPGFGEPTLQEPAPPTTFPEVASTVIEATAELGMDRFSLLGVSFGGATAAWLATRRPELLKRLILVAPAALRAGGALPRLGPDEIARALRAHPERGGSEAPAPEVAERRLAYVDSVLSTADKDGLRAALDGLDIPSMIVFGTRDGLIPPETGREYRRLIPRSDLVYVYDAAHEVARDRPEAFAELVGDFLERGEAHVVDRRDRLINP